MFLSRSDKKQSPELHFIMGINRFIRLSNRDIVTFKRKADLLSRSEWYCTLMSVVERWSYQAVTWFLFRRCGTDFLQSRDRFHHFQKVV